jgi:hypothetical protein
MGQRHGRSGSAMAYAWGCEEARNETTSPYPPSLYIILIAREHFKTNLKLYISLKYQSNHDISQILKTCRAVIYGDPTGNYVPVFESHNGRSAVSLSKLKTEVIWKISIQAFWAPVSDWTVFWNIIMISLQSAQISKYESNPDFDQGCAEITSVEATSVVQPGLKWLKFSLKSRRKWPEPDRTEVSLDLICFNRVSCPFSAALWFGDIPREIPRTVICHPFVAVLRCTK